MEENNNNNNNNNININNSNNNINNSNSNINANNIINYNNISNYSFASISSYTSSSNNRSQEVIIYDQKPTFVVVNDDDDNNDTENVNNYSNSSDDENNNNNNNHNLSKSTNILTKSFNNNNKDTKDENNLAKSNNNNNNKPKHLNESDEDKKYQIPLPKFIKESKLMSSHADKMIPKFPKSLRDRINPFTLIFKHQNKEVRSCFGLPRVWSTDNLPSTKTAAKKTQKLIQEQNLPPQFIHRNDPLLDNLLTEGQFERYFNIVSRNKVRILVAVATLMQIFMSVFTYLKFGNYNLQRDAGITTELVVTAVVTLLVILFPKSTSRIEVVYLQILLLTNNITRIWWEDWFPPYEPSYQIFLWINFSVPTAKFWRASITGFIGIATLVIIRLIQHYDSTVNVIIAQGGSYLLYHIAVAFGTRLNEITNKALFAELVQTNPGLPAHRTYFIFERKYDKIANRFTQRFTDPEMEQGFLKFYSSESIIETGVVLSTLATSVFYVIQDINYHSSGTILIFLLLRFLVIVPSTLSLFYVSVLRRKNPHRADLLALGIFIIQMAVQCIMYNEVKSWEGSLYYLGGVMRVLTLGSSQLFFIYLIVLVPISFAILPMAMIKYGSSNTNQTLFFIIFAAIITCFSFVREKNQRMRYLVQNHAQSILKEEELQKVVIMTDENNNNSNANNNEIELSNITISNSDLSNNNNNNIHSQFVQQQQNNQSNQSLQSYQSNNSLKHSNNNNNNNTNNLSRDDLSSSSSSNSDSTSNNNTNNNHRGKKNILNFSNQLIKPTSSTTQNTSTSSLGAINE